MTPSRLAAIVLTAFLLALPTSALAANYDFVDWSAVGDDNAAGTFLGEGVSFLGPRVEDVPLSRVDGTSTVFAGAAFTPPIASGDSLEFFSDADGNTYTLALASPVSNPILHLGSVGSNLEFGVPVSKVSGDISVAGNTVSGVPWNPNDSNGTVMLPGSHDVIVITATRIQPVDDGIYLQLGRESPAPPPDTTAPETLITGGPRDGDVVGDAPPQFTFTSTEPGSTFECRTYDPKKRDPLDFVFKPCVSPHQRLDLIEHISLGEASLFEVRAIDPAGNGDTTPEGVQYRKHGKLGQKPATTTCKPVEIETVHGRGIRSNCRIVQIKRGRVPCINVITLKVRKCRFKARVGKSRSGRWFTAENGKNYAVVGSGVTLKGKPNGPYAVAAPIGDRKTSPCGVVTKASKSDAASQVELGTPLSRACSIERALTFNNATGMQLDNYATIPVCGQFFSQADTVSSIPVPTTVKASRCFMGEGAGMNDINGEERDYQGHLLLRCHTVYNSGVEVYAAKRPDVKGLPLKVVPTSNVMWRPVSSLKNIANERY